MFGRMLKETQAILTGMSKGMLGKSRDATMGEAEESFRGCLRSLGMKGGMIERIFGESRDERRDDCGAESRDRKEGRLRGPSRSRGMTRVMIWRGGR